MTPEARQDPIEIRDAEPAKDLNDDGIELEELKGKDRGWLPALCVRSSLPGSLLMRAVPSTRILSSSTGRLWSGTVPMISLLLRWTEG